MYSNKSTRETRACIEKIFEFVVLFEKGLLNHLHSNFESLGSYVHIKKPMLFAVQNVVVNLNCV